eukprot:TRINITY_DN2130_c0_g1_i1.p1 TRINITY_DN2130_c0_g1~~TRINITY_DN2130_c0_g1_i1.p1  ORF type:complete len:237 (+),score=47.99 TRINITY_DN2130_c0_g1_i1:197-907(+)
MQTKVSLPKENEGTKEVRNETDSGDMTPFSADFLKWKPELQEKSRLSPDSIRRAIKVREEKEENARLEKAKLERARAEELQVLIKERELQERKRKEESVRSMERLNQQWKCQSCFWRLNTSSDTICESCKAPRFKPSTPSPVQSPSSQTRTPTQTSAPTQKRSPMASSITDGQLSSFSADQVGKWLRENELEMYISKFKEECVDGAALLELDDSDLRSLNVRLGHRKKILRLLKNK